MSPENKKKSFDLGEALADSTSDHDRAIRGDFSGITFSPEDQAVLDDLERIINAMRSSRTKSAKPAPKRT